MAPFGGHIRGWFRLELNGPSGPAVLALQILLVFATRQNLGLNDDPAPADRRVLLPIADRRAASANKALLPPGPQAARLLPVFFTF